MSEVLVVEDNPAEALLIKTHLGEHFKARVSIAKDGEEALMLLKDPDYRPDLILLDLTLPKLDGHQVLKRVRRHIAPKVPIVIMSGSRDPNDIGEAYASGANAYVEKPSDLDQLVAAIQTVGRLWMRPATGSLPELP